MKGFCDENVWLPVVCVVNLLLLTDSAFFFVAASLGVIKHRS